MVTKEIKLKPCPFCGGNARIMADQDPFRRAHGYFATCLKCGVETPRNKRSAGEAAFAWNLRLSQEEKKSAKRAMMLIEDVLDTLVESGNGVTDEMLHEAAEKLFTARAILKGEQNNAI